MMLVESLILGVIFILTTGARCEVTELISKAGSQVVLPCKCETSRCDPAAITWSKDNKGTVWRKQSSGLQYWGSSWFTKEGSRVRCPHSEFAEGDYSLRIDGVKEEDAGLYTCKVEHKHHNTVKQVLLRIIQVSISPPAPTWGESVDVQCTVKPALKDAVFNWMLASRPFEPKNRPTVNETGSFLNEQATDELAGIWTCSVHKFSNVWEASMELSVRGIVLPAKNETKLYATLGSSLTMPCVFHPQLVPEKPLVEKLESRIPKLFNNRSVSSAIWDKSIIIQEVVPESAGEYRCGATVNGRRLTRTMQLVVAKIVKSKKKGSMVLSCQLSDSSDVTRYEWVHVSYDINGTKSAGQILTGPTVSVTENFGEWTCRYFGKNGLLGNVTTDVHLMAGLSGEKSSAASSNTGTVVGLSFLLVILLLVLAQMYKNHQRRKRILQYPALETIVHTISNEREERERNREKK